MKRPLAPIYCLRRNDAMATQGTIIKVSGPLIMASGMADVQMYDVVRVSEKG